MYIRRQVTSILLTILDLSTHYYLAFPLQNYSASEVANCFIHAFSMFEFVNEILLDNASIFCHCYKFLCLNLGFIMLELVHIILKQMVILNVFIEC